MTTINDFVPSKDNTKFNGTINNIRVDVIDDRLTDEIVQHAEKIINLFLERKDEVFHYLYNDLSSFYSQYSFEQMVEKLNDPVIEISSNRGYIVWSKHDLDHEHIITLEFNGDLVLSSVSLDG